MKSEQHGELDEFGTAPRRALKSSSWLRLPKKACLRGHWYWRALQNGSPLLFQGTKTKNSEGWPGHLWNSLCVSGKKHSIFDFNWHWILQALAVLSTVSIIYLSVIIYLPGNVSNCPCLCIHVCKHSDHLCPVLQSAFVKMPTSYFLFLSETRVGVWNRGDASESTMMMMNMRLKKKMIIRLMLVVVVVWSM